MMNWIRTSLRVKLMLSFILVIFVIVTSIGWYSYREISKSIKSDIEQFSSQILKQANLNLERYYREYEQGFLQLGTSSEFEEWLKLKPDQVFEFYQYFYGRSDGSGMLRNYITPFVFRHPEIMSISLKSDIGNEYHYTPKGGLDKDYSLDDEHWIQEANHTDKVLMRVVQNPNYFNENRDKQTYVVMSMVKRFGELGHQGYLKMDVSLEPVKSILEEVELGRNSVGYILDKEGTVIVHPDDDQITKQHAAPWTSRLYKSDHGAFFIEESHEMVVFETISYTQWKSIVVVDYTTVAGSVERIRTVTFVVAVAGLLLAVLLVFAMMTPITRRISNLRRMMKRTQLGEFDQRMPIDGKDELADLGRSFNQMLEHLDESVQQLAESKMRQQKAVMSALQSQINSHFLYNTLESINSMAILSDHKEIEQTTVNLSNMLRYTSSYKNAVVTVQDEIQHAQDYLKICQIRYSEVLTYDIRVEPECEIASCLKALLQPMVENAIKYGIETTGSAIHISIDVFRREDQVVMRIQDNGPGFEAEKLRKLQWQLSDEHQLEKYDEITQIGILNVNYRLKTYYRPLPAGVRLDSTEPHGAEVTITFPCTQSSNGGRRL